jgi:outer membrane protein OmpA-like peptidoglycan-associated protein
MKHSAYIVLFIFIAVIHAIGQGNVVKLRNPSFESIPAGGGTEYFYLPQWMDCARLYFPNETPPDIHSANSDFFDVRFRPYDGETFLGMVAREHRETYEMVGQRLGSNLLEGKCYEFSIFLARSDTYLSNLDNQNRDDPKKNFNKALKLRIWGGTNPCSKMQLLAESPLVHHVDWQQYIFKIKPVRNYQFLLLEAFYKTPVLMPYNGNILLDLASDFVEIPCPDEKELAVVKVNKPPAATNNTPETSIAKANQNRQNQSAVAAQSSKKSNTSTSKKQEDNKGKTDKILKELEKDKVLVGQTIRIEQLYFDADSTNIKQESDAVLDEIYLFLSENPNVIIEIGGHTNGVPPEDYCNMLSSARAKNVAEFLYKKGIPTFRIKYRGYGKTKPIASNNTIEGRRKNQRVEIKILYIGDI